MIRSAPGKTSRLRFSWGVRTYLVDVLRWQGEALEPGLWQCEIDFRVFDPMVPAFWYPGNRVPWILGDTATGLTAVVRVEQFDEVAISEATTWHRINGKLTFEAFARPITIEGGEGPVTVERVTVDTMGEHFAKHFADQQEAKIMEEPALWNHDPAATVNATSAVDVPSTPEGLAAACKAMMAFAKTTKASAAECNTAFAKANTILGSPVLTPEQRATVIAQTNALHMGLGAPPPQGPMLPATGEASSVSVPSVPAKPQRRLPANRRRIDFGQEQ